MSDLATDGIHLTKKYYKDFLPTDLQWNVTSIADNFTLYDIFMLVYQAEIVIPSIVSAFGMSHFGEFWDQINLDRDPNDKDDIE